MIYKNMRMQTIKLLTISFVLLISLTIFSSENPQLGKRLPNWTLPDADGNNYSTNDWNGKVLILNYINPNKSDLNTDIDRRVRNSILSGEIDIDKVQMIGIVNCSTTWKPNFLIERVATEMFDEFLSARAILLFDHEGLIQNYLELPSDDYSFVAIASVHRKLKFLYIGDYPDDKFQHFIDEVVKLTKPPPHKFLKNSTKENKTRVPTSDEPYAE